ncbi:LPS-assembly protein LptD [Candidatus Pelagibacter sp. HIMB1485]|uniref:LPS-assembly protein LptD n=1 Tax=Candidatus Pelagibacter sp. HIMB1485 TaxID=3415415 RepID=UPI003F851566
MKNRFLFLFLFLFLSNISFANESFNFDVTEVEIKEEGNIFIGKNGGTAKSIDGTLIKAKNFYYNKNKNILIATDEVRIDDPKNNIIIYSNKITYKKNEELIFSEGDSKAIDSDVQIDAANFEYNKIENIIYAKGNVKINNKKENYLIYSNKITYKKNEELIFSEGDSKAIDSDVQIDAANFEYNKIENIIYAKGNVKINNKKENYLIYSDNATYKKKLGKIFTKNNSKAISEGVFIDAQIFNYDQNLKILNAKGNVKIDDKIENIVINTDSITYYKLDNRILTKGKTKTIIENKYEFISKDVILDRTLQQLSSNNKSTLKDDNSNFYLLSNFLYFYEEKLLKGEKVEVNTNYEKEKSDKYYFDSAFINLLDNSFISKDTKISVHKNIFDGERIQNKKNQTLMGKNDPRIYGPSSSGNNEFTTINKGVFTSCKKNDSCPPWSMRANKIIHDKKKKNIIYENAVLNLYDMPVFYFPKFFHPDPSVERRSGLLQPILNDSDILGSSLNIPYFHVISDNKDLTFKPTIFDNRIYMLQNEYRQENKNSSLIADFSYIKGYQSKKKGEKYSNRNSISHVFTKFDLDLGWNNFATSKINFFLEKVNNDNYLSIFDNALQVDKKFNSMVKSKTSSRSGLKLSLDTDDYNFTTGMNIYENLQLQKNDRYQYNFPYYSFSKSLFSNEKGTISFSTSGSNSLSKTNNLRTTIKNNINYKNNKIINEKGFVHNFGIYFRNLNGTGKNDAKYKSSIESDVLNISEINTSLPLIKSNKNFTNYITPKVSFRINPTDMKDSSSSSRTINVDNIFSINRLGLNDYESGKSLTLGLDYKKEKNDEINKFFEVKLATVLRDVENNKLPTTSTINRTTSNLFGSISNNFSENVSISYNFALDNDFNTLENNSIGLDFSINNFVTKFDFKESNGEMGDSNVIKNSTSFDFNDGNSLIFETRRNRKISLTEYYDLVYEYRNDCLTAGFKYRKTYYRDRDLRPKEDLFLTLTLFPLSTFDQKVEESAWRGDNAIQNIFK